MRLCVIAKEKINLFKVDFQSVKTSGSKPYRCFTTVTLIV